MRHNMLNFNYRIMKQRSILLVLAVFFSLVLSAQSLREINGKRILFVGVTLNIDGKLKGQVTIDYGFYNRLNTEGKYSSKITDANGNPLLFNDKLSVINYMTLQGWTYMNSMDVIYGGSITSIFAREVSEEEANEILPKLASPKRDELEKGKKK